MLIEITCPKCNGTGELWRDQGETGNTCGHCHGTGKLTISAIVNASGVFDSYQVLECLDATEHNGLTDTQKDGVLHLLACGLVDLNDDKAGKTRLWNWFGAESTTVASLTALLS
jgi:hypothetical protein